MRGQVYELGDGGGRGPVRVFAMGGAASHDREYRTEGWDWFAEEMPSPDELAAAEARLDAAGWDVDLVVSHCCSVRMLPKALAAAGVSDARRHPDALNAWFDVLEDRLAYSLWCFGHYHADARLDGRHRLLYRDVVRGA